MKHRDQIFCVRLYSCQDPKRATRAREPALENCKLNEINNTFKKIFKKMGSQLQRRVVRVDNGWGATLLSTRAEKHASGANRRVSWRDFLHASRVQGEPQRRCGIGDRQPAGLSLRSG